MPMFDEDWEKRREGDEFAPVARQGADPVGRRVRRLGQPGDHRIPRRPRRPRPLLAGGRRRARHGALDGRRDAFGLRQPAPRAADERPQELSGRARCSSEVEDEIDRILQLWAQARARFGGTGEFLFGDWCAADIMFAPVVTRFITYGVPVPPFAATYMKAVLSHPHVAEWIDKAQDEPG